MSSTSLVRGAAVRSLLLTPLLAAGLALGAGAPSEVRPHAEAATGSLQATQSTAPVTIKTEPVTLAYSTRLKAVQIAALQKGDPYRWGAAGPSAFDCSGLVYYVYKTKLNRYLPRTANNQRLATIRIARSEKRPGDLIFFMSGGRAYHVGIYAGDQKIWHSPRTGETVKLSRIWTTSYVVGRVK